MNKAQLWDAILAKFNKHEAIQQSTVLLSLTGTATSEEIASAFDHLMAEGNIEVASHAPPVLYYRLTPEGLKIRANLAKLGYVASEIKEKLKSDREQLSLDKLINIAAAIDKQKEDGKIIKIWTIISAIFIILTFVATIYLLSLSQKDKNRNDRGGYHGQNDKIGMIQNKPDSNENKGREKKDFKITPK